MGIDRLRPMTNISAYDPLSGNEPTVSCFRIRLQPRRLLTRLTLQSVTRCNCNNPLLFGGILFLFKLALLVVGAVQAFRSV